jgi:coenzyme F420-reducing hydrogenase delta subunit
VKHSEVLLKEIGGNGRYVAMSNLSPNAPHKFVKIIDEMNERIKKSGEVR